MRFNNPIQKTILDHKRITGYYDGSIANANQTTVALLVSFLVASPIPVRRGFNIDRIQFEVTTLGVGECIVGIYDSLLDGTLYPNTLLVNGTVQDTGSVGIKENTISSRLENDTLYWFVYSANVAATCRGITAGNLPIILGHDGTAKQQFERSITVARVHDSTLPSTFPAGGVTSTGLSITIKVRCA